MPIGQLYTKLYTRSNRNTIKSARYINGTIWENITMGNTEIKHSEVTTLVESCGLSSFIKNLPKGYDTILDPSGIKLTGKIRQNVIIIKSFIRKSEIAFIGRAIKLFRTGHTQRENNRLSDEKRRSKLFWLQLTINHLQLMQNRIVYLEERACKSDRQLGTN